MQLVHRNNRFLALTEFSERDLPKAAGFRWDADCRCWFAPDAEIADELRDYAADETVLAALDAAKVALQATKSAAEAKRLATIEASRARDADVEIPCREGRTFLPYQRAGIAYSLTRPNVLIGDDMGLGKTAQAIGVVNADETVRSVLVICPASLTRNWVREFGAFGTRDLSIGLASTKAVPDTDIVVATYDVFSRATPAAAAIKARKWGALILDEAHYLKNRDSKRTVAILGGRVGGETVPGIVAQRRLYLTGTPITNRPVELWPLAHSLAPKLFPDFMAFAKRYCDAKSNGYGWDFSGASNLGELQDRLRSSIMVRRLKAEVLAELPAKRRQVLELEASTPELRKLVRAEVEVEARTAGAVIAARAAARKAKASVDPRAYAAAVAALKAARAVAFTEMSRVHHATAVAKAPLVVEHVRDAVEGGGKVIVFAHHTDVVEALRSGLADLGAVSITGDTPPAKRQGIVDRFQGDEKIRIFIGNIQAAGVGLTLTAAAHVIFAELDWVPGNLSQAEDRAHRIGQRQSVLVQHLVLEGSLDATMAARIVEKQGIIDAALDGIPDAERSARIEAVSAEVDVDEDAEDLAVAEAEPVEAVEVVDTAPEPDVAVIVVPVAA